MNTLSSLKRLLACALALTLITTSAFAISKEKLAELQAKAEAGNGISQYNLGLVYADPQEPIGNILEAYVWFSLAAENGAPGKALMIVANQLTPDQLSEGKKLLEKRRAALAAPKSPVIAAATNTPDTANSPAAPSPVIVAPAAPDNSALHAEIAATKAKLATAEASLAKAGATATELASAKQNLAGLNDQIQKLTGETQRLNSLIKQTESAAETKAAASEKTINDINGELLKTQARLAEISNQSSIQSSVAANANTELAAQRRTNTELTALTQKLTAEKDQAVAQATKATAESQQQIAALTTRLTATDEALAKASAEQTELKSQLAAARAASVQADKNAEIEAKANEVAAEKQRQIDALTSRLTATDEALAKASAEQTELKSQLATARAENVQAGKNAELEIKANEIAAERQQQIDALTARLTAANEALTKASADQNELKSQLAAARAENVQADKSAELEAKTKEIAGLQARLKEAEDALVAAKTAQAHPAAQTAETENQMAALKKELAETQTKLDVSLRSYQLQQNEIDRLQNALANIDNERAKLAERIETASTEVTNATNKAAANNEAASQLAGVREQLRQTQNQLASVAYENAEMKRRIAFTGPTPQAGTISPLPISLPATTSFNTPSRPGATKPATTDTAVAPAATARVHTVVTGDTLSTIAKRYYGSTGRWPEILEANKPALKDPASLRIGMKLKIP